MGEDNGLLRVKPMDHLERHRRRNRCLSLTLLALFLGICGSLLVWRIRHHAAVEKAIKASKNTDDDAYDDDDITPAAGLVDLNLHLKDQSKIMEKGCESTLLILRHCEKLGPSEVDKNGNFHCSYLGQERAYFLATLFGTRWPNPSQLFALTPERDDHLNFREYETLHPLSLKTGIPIEIADESNLPGQYFRLLQSGDMCGKLTVVSWKHAIIPDLAQRLGCTEDDGCPSTYPEETFDQVWQLKYVFYPWAPDDLEEEKEFLHNAMNRRLQGSRKQNGWRVFATVSQQGFDPLAFSYKAGDYPDGGSPTGGKWKPEL